MLKPQERAYSLRVELSRGPAEALLVDPPFPAAPALLDYGGARRQYDAHVVARGYLLYEEVVLADVHVEVSESVYPEVEAFGESHVVAAAAVRTAAYCRCDPLDRGHESLGAHDVVRQAGFPLIAAVSEDYFAPGESAGHERQPAVGPRRRVGRGENDVFVVRGLNADVDCHFGRYGEVRLGLDLGGVEIGVVEPHLREVLIEVGVEPDIYHHDFECAVLLCQQLQQSGFEELGILREERHDDRYFGFVVVRTAFAPVVAVFGDTGVDEGVIVCLYGEKHDDHDGERRSLPAVMLHEKVYIPHRYETIDTNCKIM